MMMMGDFKTCQNRKRDKSRGYGQDDNVRKMYGLISFHLISFLNFFQDRHTDAGVVDQTKAILPLQMLFPSTLFYPKRILCCVCIVFNA